jgi:hypothetical protein
MLRSTAHGPALAALLLLAAACDPAARRALGPVDGHELPPSDTGRVAVGDVAPDFSLASYDDGVVTLSELRGQKEVILLFYRGYW